MMKLLKKLLIKKLAKKINKKKTVVKFDTKKPNDDEI
jgi:hypothetical protein